MLTTLIVVALQATIPSQSSEPCPIRIECMEEQDDCVFVKPEAAKSEKGLSVATNDRLQFGSSETLREILGEKSGVRRLMSLKRDDLRPSVRNTGSAEWRGGDADDVNLKSEALKCLQEGRVIDENEYYQQSIIPKPDRYEFRHGGRKWSVSHFARNKTILLATDKGPTFALRCDVSSKDGDRGHRKN